MFQYSKVSICNVKLRYLINWYILKSIKWKNIQWKSINKQKFYGKLFDIGTEKTFETLILKQTVFINLKDREATMKWLFFDFFYKILCKFIEKNCILLKYHWSITDVTVKNRIETIQYN